MNERRTRWRRLVVWVPVVLLAVAILAVIGLEVAVRQPGVQHAIQQRLAVFVAERTGMELRVDELRASLFGGWVEVEGLSLGRPGEVAALRTEHIEVEWRLSSLWSSPFTLERLVITDPQVDLGSPLPSMAVTSDQGDSDFALVIEHFELEGGHVEGPVLTSGLQEWIETWWLEDLRIDGWYGLEGLGLNLDSLLCWRRSDGLPVKISVDGELEGPAQGPWDLTRLSLSGEGLEAEMSGILGFPGRDPVVTSFDVQVDPHLLIPVAPARGTIEMRGQFDTGRKSGDLWLVAPGVPIEVVSPWLGMEAGESPWLADWILDVDADLVLVEPTAGLTGTGQLRLARQEITWATGELVLLAPETAGEVAVRLDGRILPDRAGQRSIRATLEAPEWTQIKHLSVSDSDLEIEDTDLATLREDLASVWPEPLPESLSRNMVGVLDAVAHASGPVEDLHLDLNAVWSDGDTAKVELSATASADHVVLESFSGQIGDRQFDGAATVSLPMPIGTAEARVHLMNFLPEVPEARVSLELQNGVAEIDAQTRTHNGLTSLFTAGIPLASLGDLPMIERTLAALPIIRSAGPVRFDWQVPEGEWVEWASRFIEDLPVSSLRLGSHGSMQFDLSHPLAGRGRMVVEPLAIESQEQIVVAEGPVRLRFEDGQLILEAVHLATGGGMLEVEAWANLASSWRRGDPFADLIRSFRVDVNGATPLVLVENWIDDVHSEGDLQVALSVYGSPQELQGEARLHGLEAELRIGDAEGVRISGPALEMAFAGDQLRVDRARLGIDEGEIVAEGAIPIPTLLSLLGIDSVEPGHSLEPLHIRWEIPEADWATSLSKVGVEEPPDSLVMAARGGITLDPKKPLDATGWIEISTLSMSTKGHQVRNEGPLRAELADGRLDLKSLKLLADDQPFAMAGSVELDPKWSSPAPWRSLVESLALEGHGTLAAVLLNPFLAGGSADGLLEIDFDLAGSLEELQGGLQIRGPEASILYFSPYVAKLEAPELDIELVDGRAVIRDGRLRLNGGDVELDGMLALDGAELFAAFDGLRFRLDQGLLVRLDGEMNLALDSAGRGHLTGEIIVDQGSLTRPISIDRDFLTALLSPIDLTGTEVSPLEQIELDLVLNTRRGVRVHNNVADLAVQWDEVRVRGNLLQPVVDGQFRVEPGGRAFLFGQTLRIDRGVMTFPGQAGAEAILDLETTSSLYDPGISRLAGDDALSLGEAEVAEDLESRAREAGWSAAAFVSEQVATRIADAIPAARITFRPILIFGEADPGARLTIGRDFSRYVTLAASIDLRNAERQTYLMDAHNIPRLPGLVVQVFTNDKEQEGFTVQHRLRFGNFRRTAPTGPTLRRMAIDEVPKVSKRALRRSVGLAKGDRASVDDLFLAEVEVGEFLRRQGYPDARVEVESRVVPERSKKVDIEISIAPGPRVHFEFSGEELPRALHRSITPLYRGDFYEPMALAEMETQTIRALRSLGFLFPMVQISVEAGQDAEGREERRVKIVSMGGDQALLDVLEIVGVSQIEVDQISDVFGTRLRKVELATAEPSADRRLLSALQGLGYPEPEILGRAVSEDGRRLEVTVDPGALRHVHSVTVQGVDPGEASRMVEAAGIQEGEVARRDRIAEGAMAIESDLRARGFVNAQVTPTLEAGEGQSTVVVDLVYQVTSGTALTVADAEFSGLRSTSRRWATNVAEMESGAPLREDEVAAARSRLYETGLFTMVRSDSFITDSGEADVVFDVEERPRFSTAYGLRWDSDEGSQAVVDVVDQNFVGRSVTLGLRALYKTDDWSVRMGAGVPRLLGTRATLEIYGSFESFFDEIEDEFFLTQFDEQEVEASLQVAYPFSQHLSGRVYGRYRTADLLVTDIDKDPEFPFPPLILDFNFKTPLLGTLWIYDTRNRELVLNRGLFASLDLSGTGEALNSDFEYIRMFTQFNLYRPFKRWAGRRLSWAQSLRLGLADSFDQELDRNDRFFAGGQYSVRGYPTDSLGPVEVLGDTLVRPLGGKTLVVINEELRFDLMGPVAGLVFFDLGNVWEDTAEFSSDLFKSLGLGVRAVTPVGLLRLDLAFPLDRREGDPSSKIYFGFGNTF